MTEDDKGGVPDDADSDIPFEPVEDTSVPTQAVNEPEPEDMSRRDGPQSTTADNSLGSITGWHPFLRFLYRVADMVYAYIPDRKRRVHIFIGEHPIIFKCLFWCDFAVVVVGVLGIIAVILFGAARTVGILPNA
ncbi:hypothetical protein [Bifidobacterium castoris]|uniref:Uncharacterized protein n=1 Tax=Bifidobacterium castoris TaxID=2306972 RepID=A0A430F528_9BIFI|nr:hypothetical protein [Bifidobacterium castoris]RSX46086.1 hypothetical protein D2E22_1658 [Bifidobacterium castoris]